MDNQISQTMPLHLQIAAIRPQLLRRAQSMAGPYRAEDLVHDAMERALRSADQFQPGTNLLAWVSRIMNNLAVDEWRRREIRPRAALAPETMAAPSEEEPPEWKQVRPEQIWAAMRSLSPVLRTTMDCHYREGLPYREIANRLGISAGTVGTRLMRAREKIKQSIT
jgi:RNA polymerase sigma-70 factor (ECF subfamily)